MSDDTEQYLTAWSDIFGSSQTRKILCGWHIDRAWRKALNQHIPFQDDRVQIYHQLRMLLTETNESEFRVMLQALLTYSEKYHFNFYKYFSTYYCKRVEQWGSCYKMSYSSKHQYVCRILSQGSQSNILTPQK